MTNEQGFWIFVGVSVLGIVIAGYAIVLFAVGFLYERGVSFRWDLVKTRYEKGILLTAIIVSRIVMAITAGFALMLITRTNRNQTPHS